MDKFTALIVYPYGNNVEYEYDNLADARKCAEEENDEMVKDFVAVINSDRPIYEDMTTDSIIDESPYVMLCDYYINDLGFEEYDDDFVDGTLNLRTEVNKALGRDEDE